MNYHAKSIPGFQFKIRFNSSPSINSWEVWAYRLGETDPNKAKWMQVTKETAAWYQETKGAIVEAYVPSVAPTPFMKDTDILVDDIVEAATVKGTDSSIIKHSQFVLRECLKAYNNEISGSQMEEYYVIAMKKHIKKIRQLRAEIDPITDLANQMNSFDDSDIQEL